MGAQTKGLAKAIERFFYTTVVLGAAETATEKEISSRARRRMQGKIEDGVDYVLENPPDGMSGDDNLKQKWQAEMQRDPNEPSSCRYWFRKIGIRAAEDANGDIGRDELTAALDEVMEEYCGMYGCEEDEGNPIVGDWCRWPS